MRMDLLLFFLLVALLLTLMYGILETLLKRQIIYLLVCINIQQPTKIIVSIKILFLFHNQINLSLQLLRPMSLVLVLMMDKLSLILLLAELLLINTVSMDELDLLQIFFLV